MRGRTVNLQSDLSVMLASYLGFQLLRNVFSLFAYDKYRGGKYENAHQQ